MLTLRLTLMFSGRRQPSSQYLGLSQYPAARRHGGVSSTEKSIYRPVQKGARAMKIRPHQDRVIVKRLEQEDEKTKGGLINPHTAKENPQQGKIVAVGKGKVNDDGKINPLDVKVGDKILFGKYAGSEIKLEGEDHLILREDDILGVVEGGAATNEPRKRRL
jgi:chaperonin GroES